MQPRIKAAKQRWTKSRLVLGCPSRRLSPIVQIHGLNRNPSGVLERKPIFQHFRRNQSRLYWCHSPTKSTMPRLFSTTIEILATICGTALPVGAEEQSGTIEH